MTRIVKFERRVSPRADPDPDLHSHSQATVTLLFSATSLPLFSTLCFLPHYNTKIQYVVHHLDLEERYRF